jgi:hypothetical protein
MSMPGNGTLQVKEQQQQLPPAQQLLPGPLRPGSGQVTPVLGMSLNLAQYFPHPAFRGYVNVRLYYRLSKVTHIKV